MKTLRMVMLIVGILVAGLAFNSVAHAAVPSKYATVTKNDHHKDKHKNKNKIKREKSKPTKTKDKHKNKPAKAKTKLA